MKPAPFDYVAPATIEEACAALAEAGGGATILAGGQTLMPLLNLRMSQPFIIVDINKIAALQGISRADGCTRIGPMTRQCDVIASEVLARDLPVLVASSTPRRTSPDAQSRDDRWLDRTGRARGRAASDCGGTWCFDRGALDPWHAPYPGWRFLSRPVHERARAR